MTRTRTSTLGPAARPVAVPDDVDSPGITKATGRVELPNRVRWSGPRKVYDLDRREDQIRVYEQVLREGNDDDVRHYIDVESLIELWEDLVLPPHVRHVWVRWLREHRAVHVEC